MNKKIYKEAVDEIHVDEKAKKELLNKFTNKKHGTLKYITALATMVVVIVMISFFSQRTTKMPEITVEKLPSVENFDNLYTMLKKSASKNKYSSWGTNGFLTKGVDSVDLAVAENAESTKTTVQDSTDYSKTNTQVEGVDEADIVKTDGKYIYYVSNSKIVIVNAIDSNNLQIEAEIEYDRQQNTTFNPIEIYLFGDKLIVVGNKYYQEENENKYGYYYGKNFTTAKVYNVNNKKDLSLEREVELEGNYLSSRMIDNNIYLVANKGLYLYRLYDTEITDIKEEDYQVQYKDTAINSAFCPVGYDRMYYIPDTEYTSYINIAAFNVNNKDNANIKSYLGAGDEVYCSENNLYITNNMYEYKNYGFYQSQKIETAVNKFKLDKANVEFVAQGIVPGTPINQFAMDESKGYFRIATTNNTSWNNNTSTNNMYVLDSEMNIIGRLEGLAKGERIYSVRFIGTRAYMVTFVQTDPLFVIDLSKPEAPTVLGELKIPGYSKYLHPYDETHLIGFGEDTETTNYGYGEVTITNGMKMALFDVADPNNPKELFTEKIGERGTSSEVLYNHKALCFSKEKNIIAFPISIRENEYKTSFQGAIVYGLTLDKGFELKGKISHIASENGKFQYDYTKQIERIIYIKDSLFTLSKGLIKATDMNTLEEQSKVEITVPEERFYYSIID